MTTFRQVVTAALVAMEPVRSMEAGITVHDGPTLANLLADELKAAGFSIHRSGECVHPRSRAADLGRPMTDDELVLIGLATAGEALERLEAADA